MANLKPAEQRAEEIPWQSPKTAIQAKEKPADQAPPQQEQAAAGIIGGSYARPQTRTPATEQRQLEYQRLSYADPHSRWWKPLLEAVISGSLFFLLSFATSLTWVFYQAFRQEGNMGSVVGRLDIASLQKGALQSPSVFLLLFGSVILMWPCLWLARLLLGPKPWGLIHSVAGKIRWSWLLLCIAISLVLYVIIPVVLTILSGVPLTMSSELPVNLLVTLLLLIVFLVPLQCYAEEIVFRGYLMQTVGRWLKHPVWAIVLPAPLFMMGHTYDFWGQASILTMGIAAGFMVWYTGGLEAGIAMHVVNNVYLMIMGVLGLTDPFAQEGSNWVDYLMASGLELVLVILVMYAAKKVGIERKGSYRVLTSFPKEEIY
ncbi:MAG: type II CAAX endopeptidase family protein [Rothia sp. (in: high G+C Gram-positive bacteria)]|nr:type II CAAX endopeptidase family protein [Rothia sp. (in: high G+C Gram-positive bacteria)]